MSIRHWNWPDRPRHVTMIISGVLVAAGLSAAAAPPAHASGGCRVDYQVTTNSPPSNFAVNRIPCTGRPPAPQLVVSRKNLNLTAGGLAIYTVRLSSPPTADVVVTSTRRHGATCISITSGAELTFTPQFWNFEQEVRLAAGPGCAGSASFTVRSHGMRPVRVKATSTVPQAQRLIVEPTTLVVDAVTNAYTIVLAMQPATDVLVTSTRIAGPDCIDVVSETNPWTFSPNRLVRPPAHGHHGPQRLHRRGHDRRRIRRPAHGPRVRHGRDTVGPRPDRRSE